MDPKSPTASATAEATQTLDAELASFSEKERQLMEDNHRLRNELAAAKLKLRAADTVIARMKELLALWK
jgi:hypothetical protein